MTDIFTDENTARVSKKAWTYIKSKRKDKVGIPPLKNERGKLCNDARDKADILLKQYTSVFTKDNPREGVPNVTYGMPSMPEINIDDNGILKLLEDINIHKATGPDQLPNRILKECSREIAPLLGETFRKSIREGKLPSDWLKANIIGIYKKGSKSEAGNYRPVSLTSVTCKILEHIIFSQIMKHYTRNNFINPAQHGFLKGHSCETQLITTIEDLQKGLDSRSQCDMIVLDFQKAFDKVPHRHLLKKLEASGVRGRLHTWITSYLTCRTQRVVVDGSVSEEAPVLSGVPQGTVLGPLMFLVYINDITANITGQLRLFADDALLYESIKSEADNASLQRDLNQLHAWSQKWKMAFNTTKCHFLHATRNRKVKAHTYTLGGSSLTRVQNHPYLGVELDEKLCWRHELDRVQSKGTKTLNMVRRNFTKGTTPVIRAQIYTSLVRPVVEYGSIV